jgi:ThiF family
MNNPANPRTCIFRITARDRGRLESLLYKRYPNREWGTFFRFGYRITDWGLHVTFADALEPESGDFKPESGIVEFSASYILRAQLLLDQSELGIGVAHSHPCGGGTLASALDDDMDQYFASEFSRYGNGRPYVSLRLAADNRRRLSFSGECWLNGSRIPVTQICTVGEVIAHHASEAVSVQRNGAQQPQSLERIRDLLGSANIERLAGSRVGIVGCSGTGSPAAHVLARAGVQHFVLVDPDTFENSNHERFHASTWHDLNREEAKVALVRRMILSINPSACVTALQGSVLEERILDELLRCDLVLGCTDTHHSRAALSDYATHYLLPCFDSAVLMRAKDGRLTEQVGELARYTADEPCAWCLGRVNQNAIRIELMPAEERHARREAAKDAMARGIDGKQYWGEEPSRELTVGYLTTTVGAMQAGYALAALTAASAMPHQRFQFDVGMPLLGVVPAEKSRRQECQCNRTKGWGDQARADRSVTASIASSATYHSVGSKFDTTKKRSLIPRILRFFERVFAAGR